MKHYYFFKDFIRNHYPHPVYSKVGINPVPFAQQLATLKTTNYGGNLTLITRVKRDTLLTIPDSNN